MDFNKYNLKIENGPTEEFRLSTKYGLLITTFLVKLTEHGIFKLNLWLHSNNKDTSCPFYGVCSICGEIFDTGHDIQTGGLNGGGCPCINYGEAACIEVAKEVIRFSTIDTEMKPIDDSINEDDLKEMANRVVDNWK